ncbi:MAG: flagellar basal body rod protein FlgB [Nitrospirae bacterium]|nr:flagellar basal body rod protein FlgB [Nitrospirota bacterium]MCL5237169.1 flagellar basal body rod protein FlgB [Nitrospirota bacterium]
MQDKGMAILERMLDVTAFRQKLLASNIANADTPGYKAKDVSFQKELDKVMDGGQPGYDVYEPVTTMPNRDGNTVNLDIEMAKVAENTLIYNAATQLMMMKMRMNKDVIRGGR